MVESGKTKRRRAAVLANLISQMRRSPELARLMILLLVWSSVRARAGYSTLRQRPAGKKPRGKDSRRKKSFSLKRPRERFL